MTAESNQFTNINKSTVFQEARIFHESQIKPQKCIAVLTKILYLMYQGEVIATTEATEAFFAMTKLFQSQDVHAWLFFQFFFSFISSFLKFLRSSHF